jgi:hypothetical protein
VLAVVVVGWTIWGVLDLRQQAESRRRQEAADQAWRDQERRARQSWQGLGAGAGTLQRRD